MKRSCIPTIKPQPGTAAAVLQEFIRDIKAVGVKQTAADWPDLVITYRKAEKALRLELQTTAKPDPLLLTAEGYRRGQIETLEAKCECGQHLYGIVRVHWCNEKPQASKAS